MKQVTVTSGVLNISAGAKVRLSADQAKPRAHKLEAVKGSRGLFVATAPLQFKTGEKLGVEDVSKRELDQVEIAAELSA